MALLCIALATPQARAQTQPASYHAVYVVVNPYSAADMEFLYCAQLAPANIDRACHFLSASQSAFINPFTNNMATGIMLRLPWCGYQTDSLGTNATSCHYRLAGGDGTQPDRGQGISYVVGEIAASPGNIRTALIDPFAAGPQIVDTNINALSPCPTQYDTCPTGVLATALTYIARIAANSPSPLSLSIGLAPGMYTPRSVLDDPAAGYLDMPDKLSTRPNQPVPTFFCERQPLAWRPQYIADYQASIDNLVAYVTSFPATLPPITILKVAPFSKGDLEFSALGPVGIVYTPTDPGYTGGSPAYPAPQNGVPYTPGGAMAAGPQNDGVIFCPDQYPVPLNGATALLAAYANAPIRNLPIAKAYDYSFGTAIGYEAGMLKKYGLSAILSVANRTEEFYAHIDCHLGGGGTCIVDPSPAQPQFGWSKYYFAQFVLDAFSANAMPPSLGYAGATAGYALGCGATCGPRPVFALQPSQLAIVWTGLAPQGTAPPPFNQLMTCWMHNATPGTFPAATQTLFNSPINFITHEILGNGTAIGFQTNTNQGQYCNAAYTGPASYASAMTMGETNGAQFLEIEPDAATEPQCTPALTQTATYYTAPTTQSCLPGD